MKKDMNIIQQLMPASAEGMEAEEAALGAEGRMQDSENTALRMGNKTYKKVIRFN